MLKDIVRRQVILLFILTCGVTKADVVVVPNEPGVNYNGLPFWSGLGEARYHQIVSRALFEQPTRITSLAFSPSTVESLSGNVEISMGTTQVQVQNISDELEQNITSPLSVVFSDSSFDVAVSEAGHDAFSIVFDIEPYLYLPQDGNILIEIRTDDMLGESYAMSIANNSSVVSRAWQSNGTGSLAGGFGNEGLRIQMNIAPVPESSSANLALICCLSILVRHRSWSARAA